MSVPEAVPTGEAVPAGDAVPTGDRDPDSEVTRSFLVRAADSARALGSGDVEVLATPRLLAWCEAVTCLAAGGAVGPGRTSVGTRVALEHLLATPVGGTVRVTARREASDGRLLRFAVAALDAHDRLVATGQVTRVVVDRERFLARVPPA